MKDKDIVHLVNTCLSNLQDARTMLESNPSLVHERTSIDETALILLLRWYSPENCDITQHINAIKMLLDFGADIYASNGCGSNPIHNAISSREIDVVKYLIENGADINAKDDFGQTPIHMTADKDSKIEFTKLLIHYGADVNTISEFHCTPLDEAYSEGSILNITYLIDKGASINSTTWDNIPTKILEEEKYSELLKPLYSKDTPK